MTQDISQLTLYIMKTCPFCVKVWQKLQQMQLDVAMVDINDSAQARQKLLTGGGKTQVPCLHINKPEKESWLFESDDIIRYFEQNFGSESLSR